MSDPQLQRKTEEDGQSRARLKYLYARKDILSEVKSRADGIHGPARTTASDYYDAWRDLYYDNELAIGIEERRAGGGRNEP